MWGISVTPFLASFKIKRRTIQTSINGCNALTKERALKLLKPLDPIKLDCKRNSLEREMAARWRVVFILFWQGQCVCLLFPIFLILPIFFSSYYSSPLKATWCQRQVLGMYLLYKNVINMSFGDSSTLTN